MGQLRDRLGDAPFWSRDEMLSHGFDFRPMWWKRRVPSDSWTASLFDLPEAARGRQYRHITRGDLLTATNNRPDDIGRLLVGCYAWGTRDLGFVVGRRAQVFVKNSPDAITDKLARALAVLRGTGPVAAYEALARGRKRYPQPQYSCSFPGDRLPGDPVGDCLVAVARIRTDSLASRYATHSSELATGKHVESLPEVDALITTVKVTDMGPAAAGTYWEVAARPMSRRSANEHLARGWARNRLTPRLVAAEARR